MPKTWGLLHVMVGDCLITCLLSNGDNENKNVLDVIGTVSKIMMTMLIFFYCVYRHYFRVSIWECEKTCVVFEVSQQTKLDGC